MNDHKKIQKETEELIIIQLAEVLKTMIRRMDKVLHREGIPLPFDQAQPFMALFTFGEMSQTKAAELTGRNQASMQRTIQSLKKRGLVSVRLDRSFKRKNLVKVTGRGQALAKKIHRNAMRLNKEISKNITLKELNLFRKTLTKIKTNLSNR